MRTEVVTPHSLEAERAVIGAVLVDPAGWPTLSSELTADDFFRSAHAYAYAAMAALSVKGVAIDPLTVCEQLRADGRLDECGGPAYVMSLADGVPRAANLSAYSGIVREKARLRALAALGAAIVDEALLAAKPAADLAETAVRRLVAMSAGSGASAVPAKAAAGAYVDVLVAGTSAPPVPTGYLDLDRLTGGFRASDLVLVAARPSVGKTSFMLGAARHMAAHGHPVLFFSLEMAQRLIAGRLLSWESGVPDLAVALGTATAEEYAAVHEARESMPDLPLYIQTSARTVTEVDGWCRRVRQERGRLACVVVDYLQLLRSGQRTDDSQHEVAEISRGLKGIARDLDIVVVALSQLNRANETRRDKRPTPADLRGSGNLEQDADLVVLLFREEMHRKTAENAGVAEAILAKNRNGPTGTAELRFDNRLVRFQDLARREEDEWVRV